MLAKTILMATKMQVFVTFEPSLGHIWGNQAALMHIAQNPTPKNLNFMTILVNFSPENGRFFSQNFQYL